MHIQLASSDADIRACFPPMAELRPQLVASEFVARVRAQEATGYQLAFGSENGEVVAVAGFRFGQSLAWGRYAYVDDLVTLASHRSQGHGAALLAWLREYAAQAGCGQFHLDSGTHRTAAHRFYEREGMTLASYHFSCTL